MGKSTQVSLRHKRHRLELYVGRHLTGPWHDTGCIFDKVFCQPYRMGWHIGWGYCSSQGRKR